MIHWNDFSAEDKELLARAAAWEQFPGMSDCSPLNVAKIARAQGLEFATAVLYDRVLRNPANRAFLQQVTSDNADAAIPSTLIGIIPGAFYREHKNTGADGARVAAIIRSMGCPVELVPVKSFGSLAENAELIAGWISRQVHPRIALISLSKGSADMKITLALPNANEVFRHVVAWVSLSGLPQGTPLVSWLRRQPLRRLGVRLLLRLRRQRYTVVEELRPEADGPLASWPALPPGLRIIHVLGFPLRHHLAHPWAARAFDRLAPLGPNDGGGFLLAEASSLPGIVLPVWGADHYLQPAWDITPLLRAVLAAAMAPEPDFRQASQSAPHPSNPPASRSSA